MCNYNKEKKNKRISSIHFFFLNLRKWKPCDPSPLLIGTPLSCSPPMSIHVTLLIETEGRDVSPTNHDIHQGSPRGVETLAISL